MSDVRARRGQRTLENVFFSHEVIASVTFALTCLSVSKAYSSTSPVFAGMSRWLTPETLTTSTGGEFLRFFASASSLIGVRRCDLCVELALDDQERLLDVGHHLRRIVEQQALELRVVDLLPHRGRDLVPPFAGEHRLVDPFLQIHLGLLLFSAHRRSIEHVLLFFEHELRPGDAAGADHADGRDALVLRRSQQRDRAALAVSDDRDALVVDVLAIRTAISRRRARHP